MRYMKVGVIAMVAILLGGIVVVNGNTTVGNLSENPIEKEINNNLIQHAHISINNDTDFRNQAKNEGWKGNGTEDDPYIIENYDISNPNGCAIYINYTISHFIIRNCSLHDSESGIYFSDVSNGQIYNNTIYNNMNGTYLEWSTGLNIFFHNNFINNTWQATDNSGGENKWYNDYLHEGNYWSDYSGEDVEGDPNYSPGADGIGDYGYEIDCCASDDYPLMVPWGSKDTDAPHLVINRPSNNTVFGTGSFYGIEIEWRGWDDSTGINRYYIKLDSNNWSYLPVDAYLEPYYEIDDIEEGNHSFSVKAVDAFGNENVSTIYFTVDFTAPMVNITNASFSSGSNIFNTSSGQICLNWTGHDNISGISSYAIGLRKGYEYPEEIQWETLGLINHYCFNFSRLSDGYYYLYIGARDKAGNGYKNMNGSYYYSDDLKGVSMISFIVDTTAPYIIVYSPTDHSYVDDSVTISWDGRDSPIYTYYNYTYYNYGSGIDFYEIRIDNGTWHNVGLNTTYSFSNLSEGVHTVQIKATDRAGNENIKEVSFTADLSKPTINITSPSDDAVFGSGEVTVWWIGNDTLSGIGHYEVRIDSGPWQNVGNNKSYFFKGLSDGFHTIDVKAVDAVGNVNITSVTFSVGYGIISGKVVDENGNPVVNATVTLDSGQSGVTDENGIFRIVAPKGTHTIIINKDGYKPQTLDASVNSGETTDLSKISLAPVNSNSSPNLTGLWIFLGILFLSAAIFIFLVYKGIIDPYHLTKRKKQK